MRSSQSAVNTYAHGVSRRDRRAMSDHKVLATVAIEERRKRRQHDAWHKPTTPAALHVQRAAALVRAAARGVAIAMLLVGGIRVLAVGVCWLQDGRLGVVLLDACRLDGRIPHETDSEDTDST